MLGVLEVVEVLKDLMEIVVEWNGWKRVKHEWRDCMSLIYLDHLASVWSRASQVADKLESNSGYVTRWLLSMKQS